MGAIMAELFTLRPLFPGSRYFFFVIHYRHHSFSYDSYSLCDTLFLNFKLWSGDCSSSFSLLMMLLMYWLQWSGWNTQDLQCDWQPVPGFMGPRLAARWRHEVPIPWGHFFSIWLKWCYLPSLFFFSVMIFILSDMWQMNVIEYFHDCYHLESDICKQYFPFVLQSHRTMQMCVVLIAYKVWYRAVVWNFDLA